ncbi:hypothetical protein TRFO_22070 [Tritrichomonas foetus]|uniref:CYRIA/CYRIB Rac1 binding domain-containing protein n=1 Tax=Tritrichomonas foetus TaxID=1144522 RepID=A0A1J4KE19_9EUKA|nr:hypothetical protein TRFO_22070 [Tritrichomonas foetus]|eukprot:OHT09152.1 hypothetical protein TRFO_22070 [Tritrichomonas foetus]
MDAQFDATEVIFSHIDLVFSNIDQIRSLLFKGSNLETTLSGKTINEVIDFLKDAEKSKSTPKPNSTVRKVLAEQEVKIRTVTELSDYVIGWAIKARRILMELCQNSVELDIRWNYLFTIRFCQIFVALCKVILFFNYFSIAKIVIQLGNYIEHRPNLSNDLSRTVEIAYNCAMDPFRLLATKQDAIQLQLGQMISQIGHFLIQVLGPWPLLDWQDFVIFNRPPKQQNDSSLPNMEHACLANLQVLTETTYFFSLAYPSFISKHPQFKALMNELLSECASISLSKTVWMPFEDILAAYRKGKDPERIPIDPEVVKQHMDIKFKLSHAQRLAHLNVLLKDILHMVEFEAAYLPMLTHDVVSLSGYAYYELCVMLNHGKPCEQVAEMIDILVRIARIYIKYNQSISRFFVFNLGSVDTNYLAQLHQQFSGDRFEWQTQLTSYVGNLLYDLQNGVDLDEFDCGTRYDFTPFIYTQGRILHFYNYLKIDNHITYLQPMFEQMENIRFHMTFAQNPVDAFLSYCPVHTLWRFISSLSEYVKQAPGGTHFLASIINLYALFNLDYISMSTLKFDVDNLSKNLSMIRADLINFFYRLMNNYLSSESSMMQIVQQNRFDKIFNPKDFILHSEFKISDYEDAAKFSEPLWQMKDLLLKLPNKINFNDTDFEICPYIAKNITEKMGNILFKKIIPDAFKLDAKFAVAAQLLWPLYTMLNASFTQKLFVAKFDQVNGYLRTNYLDLISKFKIDDEPIKKPPPSKDSKREQKEEIIEPTVHVSKIIDSFQNSLREFLDTDWRNVFYLPHSKRFSQQGNGQYISFHSFETLILNLGAYAGYYIDHILVLQATRSMTTIFKIYSGTISEINAWLVDYRKDGKLWSKDLERPEFARAGQEMIKLGVILMTRQLARQAMKKSVDKTMPGLSDLVASSYKRITEPPSEKEDLLLEMTTDVPFYHFIESSLERNNLQKTTDSTQFFFFLALLLGHSQWHDVQYHPDNEIMTHNLHLFPVALDAFINMFRVFSISADSQIIGDGMQFFFNVLQQVILKVKDMPNVDSMTINSFVILVDLFPRNIKSIEYGRTAASFPSNIIAETYRMMEKRVSEGRKNIPRNQKKKR